MENPFVYGEVVPRSAFVGREQELHRLVSDLGEGQKVFLMSPRRYGKSSLIRQALAALARRGVLTVDLTVASYSSYVGFLEGYAEALARAHVARPAGIGAWVREVLRAVGPEARFVGPGALATGASPARAGRAVTGAGRTGGQWRSLTFPGARTPRDVSRLADEIFALPQRIADERRGRLVVALDEFQEIATFDGGSVEQALRAAVQHQRQVGYVFAGSEPALMERMVGPRRPFYKAGPVMRLQKIPADVFAAFVETRFRKSGLVPEPGLGDAVVDLAGNLPYDVQRLAHETWDDVRVASRRRVTLDDLHQTLHRLLAEHAVLFEAAWQRLTLGQRAALRAVVVEQGTELLSGDVRARHRLGGPSSVQAALAALQRVDLVLRDETGRYAVLDSLFREWIGRKTY